MSSEPVGREIDEKHPRIPVGPEARNLGKLDEVERYLWEVYQRAPVKKDGSGDFTWKDPVAAKRFGISMPAYVISGMDADFREQLYHAGKAMDAAGVRWAILSAFRDDYRQSLASGFKASARNSLHGGSARVGGYGHGRAVDVTSEDNNPTPVWKWLDAARREIRPAPADARQRSGARPVARRVAQARAGAADEPHADRRDQSGQGEGQGGHCRGTLTGEACSRGVPDTLPAGKALAFHRRRFHALKRPLAGCDEHEQC